MPWLWLELEELLELGLLLELEEGEGMDGELVELELLV